MCLRTTDSTSSSRTATVESTSWRTTRNLEHRSCKAGTARRRSTFLNYVNKNFYSTLECVSSSVSLSSAASSYTLSCRRQSSPRAGRISLISRTRNCILEGSTGSFTHQGSTTTCALTIPRCSTPKAAGSRRLPHSRWSSSISSKRRCRASPWCSRARWASPWCSRARWASPWCSSKFPCNSSPCNSNKWWVASLSRWCSRLLRPLPGKLWFSERERLSQPAFMLRLLLKDASRVLSTLMYSTCWETLYKWE